MALRFKKANRVRHRFDVTWCRQIKKVKYRDRQIKKQIIIIIIFPRRKFEITEIGEWVTWPLREFHWTKNHYRMREAMRMLYCLKFGWHSVVVVLCFHLSWHEINGAYLSPMTNTAIISNGSFPYVKRLLLAVSAWRNRLLSHDDCQNEKIQLVKPIKKVIGGYLESSAVQRNFVSVVDSMILS